MKYVTGITNVTSTGNVDLYTVPANKRAILINLWIYTTAGSTIMPMVKISGSYYRLNTGSTVSINTAGTRSPTALYVAEAGESFAINTTGQPVNANFCVVEFDNTSNMKSAKLTSFAASTNTLYTVGAGKTALLAGSFTLNTTLANLMAHSNQSGGTVSVTYHIVASGGSPGSTNQISNATSNANNSVSALVGFPTTLHDGDFVNITVDSSTAGQLAWVTLIEI